MKRKLLLAVCMVGAAALLGALIPILSAAFQERWSVTHVMQTPMESPQLKRSTAWTFIDRLEHTGVSAVQAELQEGERKNATSAQVVAEEVLKAMERSHITTEDIWEFSDAVPVLVAAQGKVAGDDIFQTFKAWRCIFVDSKQNKLGFLMDEQTGLLLATLLECRCGGCIPEDTKQIAENYAEFCCEYYGFALQAMAVEKQEGEQSEYMFQFKTEAGETVCLNLSVSPEAIEFPK